MYACVWVCVYLCVSLHMRACTDACMRACMYMQVAQEEDAGQRHDSAVFLFGLLVAGEYFEEAAALRDTNAALAADPACPPVEAALVARARAARAARDARCLALPPNCDLLFVDSAAAAEEAGQRMAALLRSVAEAPLVAEGEAWEGGGGVWGWDASAPAAVCVCVCMCVHVRVRVCGMGLRWQRRGAIGNDCSACVFCVCICTYVTA